MSHTQSGLGRPFTAGLGDSGFLVRPLQRPFGALAMARTIYSEINLHITWHTKNSDPVITDSIETQLYRWLRGRILVRYVENQREHHAKRTTYVGACRDREEEAR
jgi:hypothetical protein